MCSVDDKHVVKKDNIEKHNQKCFLNKLGISSLREKVSFLEPYLVLSHLSSILSQFCFAFCIIIILALLKNIFELSMGLFIIFREFQVSIVDYFNIRFVFFTNSFNSMITAPVMKDLKSNIISLTSPFLLQQKYCNTLCPRSIYLLIFIFIFW